MTETFALQPGRLYRARDLGGGGQDAARLGRLLVEEGLLRKVGRGLFYAPVEGRFGQVPPGEGEVLRAVLGPAPFVVTGPPRWNALGLGSTAMFVCTVVYDRKRSGQVVVCGRRFLFRRVRFPEVPRKEWLVVDLLQNREMAGVGLDVLEAGLVATLREGRWDRECLRQMASEYGGRATRSLVERCLSTMADGEQFGLAVTGS